MEGSYLDPNELPCFAGFAQRGSIVLMINTVKLDSFPQTYAAREGPHQQRAKDIYHELRKNVVNNVVKVGSRESADKFDTVSDTLVQW